MTKLPTTWIKSIEMSQFRCFGSLKVEFDPRMTVIVAPNGGGKTALLDGIASALKPYVDTAQQIPRTEGFKDSDIRRVRTHLETMEPCLPVRVEARARIGPESEMVNWVRQRNGVGAGSRTSTSPRDLLPVTALLAQTESMLASAGRVAGMAKGIPGDPILPLVAQYGTGRLFSEGRLTAKKKRDEANLLSRFDGYVDCLGASSKYKMFLDWFERYSREAQKVSANGHSSPRHDAQNKLGAVRTAVDQVLKPVGWSRIEWDFVEETIVAHHAEQGTLDVGNLSDGVRGMLGLAADIAHRCVRLNPQFGEEAPRKTPGIVLIDEVDMHLHPEWQQTVIGSLLEAFPLMQFIVTTHSPQVLTTVKRENIRILSRNATGEWEALPPPREIKGVESAVALNDILGVNPIPPVDEARWLADYTAMIDNGIHEHPEGRDLRQKLEGLYGPQHPVLLDADRLIRFQDFKLRKNSNKGA